MHLLLYKVNIIFINYIVFGNLSFLFAYIELCNLILKIYDVFFPFLIQQYKSPTFKGFILKYINEIPENQWLDEKNKLTKEFNLKEQNLINEINNLKNELEKYKNENEDLKNEILKLNKIIENQPKYQIKNENNQQIKILQDENKNLKEQLNLKEYEINKMKLQIQKNIKEKELVDINDIMVINFISTDSSVHCGIKCLPTYTFAKIEEELYQFHDELRNTNNVFTVNGRTILRFKKIKENNIHDGDIVQLIKVE